MSDILVRCADERLNKIVANQFSDRLTLARLGGVKWYLTDGSIEELMKEIAFTIDHKKAQAMTLISHADCGKYKAVGEDQFPIYQADLRNIKEKIQKQFPDLLVNSYLFDVDKQQLQEIR